MNSEGISKGKAGPSKKELNASIVFDSDKGKVESHLPTGDL